MTDENDTVPLESGDDSLTGGQDDEPILLPRGERYVETSVTEGPEGRTTTRRAEFSNRPQYPTPSTGERVLEFFLGTGRRIAATATLGLALTGATLYGGYSLFFAGSDAPTDETAQSALEDKANAGANKPKPKVVYQTRVDLDTVEGKNYLTVAQGPEGAPTHFNYFEETGERHVRNYEAVQTALNKKAEGAEAILKGAVDKAYRTDAKSTRDTYSASDAEFEAASRAFGFYKEPKATVTEPVAPSRPRTNYRGTLEGQGAMFTEIYKRSREATKEAAK